MRYSVKIIETIAMTVEVDAESEVEALDKAEEKYRKEEIIVEQSGKPEVEFVISSVE